MWATCLFVAVVHVFGFCFRRLAVTSVTVTLVSVSTVIFVSNFCPQNSQYNAMANANYVGYIYEEHISNSEHQLYFHPIEV